MIKSGINYLEIEKGFIRKCLTNVGIRLDGRRATDFLPVTINISRSESKSIAEVTIGSTRVITVVSGSLCKPYIDRPTEGILNLSVDISVNANNNGVSHSEITRYLERSIRDNDTLDTESLCIKAGDKVWMITCDVKLVDFHGGAIDACTLSCIAALKAFRRPEVSLTEDGLQIHHSDAREPLPLALNHSPLAVSLGLFRLQQAATTKRTQMVMVGDCSDREEAAADGLISFSVNGHKELCAIHKPGGVKVSVPIVLQATALASNRATMLHQLLAESLRTLEEKVKADRAMRLEVLRKVHQLSLRSAEEKESLTSSGEIGNLKLAGAGAGVDRDDPILKWDSLHSAHTVTMS